ncbi:glutarate dioxygenase GlaH [Chengkuizengella sediminis]|uniref:glutarate dioxygenase GlaH n=1 Tax=Chengkuizengella sediminis TaxID=1885917 RepID=UPI001389476D|nr:glutarate dioxygenase GlaH [Chengkuizengella sediminis]NDI36894.1 carbon starvation induced protein CsiD [Chengkuizengella sediminis]
MIKESLKLFIGKYDTFEVKEHSDHKRLYHIEMNHERLNTFLSENQDVNVQQLEYVPYMRLVIAQSLQSVLGETFSKIIRNILHDRKSGGFTMGMQLQTLEHEQYVLFATALTHLLGGVNFDDMSGKYYARFTVKDTDNSDSYLRQAYRLFTLHTDGTFFDEPTDWLLMMKFAEENAIGGESRLLHLDDWEDLEKFSKHALATCRLEYKAPSSKNVQQSVYNQTFYEKNGKPCVCFIDQFVYPATLEQAAYLKDLSESMENSAATVALPLPVGDLVMVNNTFWLHGRAAFEKNPNLHRELMRIRGYFAGV